MVAGHRHRFIIKMLMRPLLVPWARSVGARAVRFAAPRTFHTSAVLATCRAPVGGRRTSSTCRLSDTFVTCNTRFAAPRTFHTSAVAAAHTGTVRWWNNKKGFGFIKPDGDDFDEDFFCHTRAIADGEALMENSTVEFEVADESRPGRMRAANVYGGHPRPKWICAECDMYSFWANECHSCGAPRPPHTDPRSPDLGTGPCSDANQPTQPTLEPTTTSFGDDGRGPQQEEDLLDALVEEDHRND